MAVVVTESEVHSRWRCKTCGKTGPWLPQTSWRREIEAGRYVHQQQHAREVSP